MWKTVKLVIADYLILKQNLIITINNFNYGIFRPQWRK